MLNTANCTQIITIFLFFLQFGIYAQGVSNLQIVNNRIYPLQENNQPFVFSYNVAERGTIESYLRTNGKAFEIAEKRTEFAGKTNLILTYKTAQKTLLASLGNSNRFSIELIHLSARSKRTSVTLPLSYKINAPFGKELFPIPAQPILIVPPPQPPLLGYPVQPKLFSEKVNKQVLNPVAVLTFLAGSALAAFGPRITDQINGNTGNEINPDYVIGAGIGVAVLSLGFWKKSKYDPLASELNKQKNQSLVAGWERDTRNVNTQNRNMEALWKSENNRVEAENKKILESHDNEVQRIIENNQIIKESYYIEIFK